MEQIEKIITWQEQLEMMEHIVLASGTTDYEAVRHDMDIYLLQKYKRRYFWTYEPIPENELDKFMEWLKEDEE